MGLSEDVKTLGEEVKFLGEELMSTNEKIDKGFEQQNINKNEILMGQKDMFDFFKKNMPKKKRQQSTIAEKSQMWNIISTQ